MSVQSRRLPEACTVFHDFHPLGPSLPPVYCGVAAWAEIARPSSLRTSTACNPVHLRLSTRDPCRALNLNTLWSGALEVARAPSGPDLAAGSDTYHNHQSMPPADGLGAKMTSIFTASPVILAIRRSNSNSNPTEELRREIPLNIRLLAILPNIIILSLCCHRGAVSQHATEHTPCMRSYVPEQIEMLMSLRLHSGFVSA